MVNLLTSLPSVCFPSELYRLDFASDLPDEETFTLVIKLGGRTLLDTFITLDSNRSFALEDFPSLLADYLDSTPLRLEIDADGTTWDCTVLPCRHNVQEPAATFAADSFLTLWTGAKPTTYESEETLAFYHKSSESTVELEVEVNDAEGFELFYNKQTLDFGGEAGVYSLRLPWPQMMKDLPAADANSFRVRVRAGQRVQVYQSHPACYGATELSHRNSFGQWETVRFTEVERKDAPTRSNAVSGGYQLSYKIEPQTTCEGVTDYLTDDGLLTFEDFLLSPTVVSLPHSVPVVITGGEIKEKSGPAELPRGKAEWREAYRLHAFSRKRKTRIFDITFDDTYN